MRNTRYFSSFAPLAALGAGGLAGYYLAVRPRILGKNSVSAQGVRTTSAEEGTSTVRTTGPSSVSTWKCPHTSV